MNLPLTRRDFLRRSGMGLGMLGLADLHAAAGGLMQKPHYVPKAKRVIHFFLNGGPSHVDTFDPKPMLAKHDGQPLPNTRLTERKTGAAFASPFKFQRYGQSGIEVSELFRNTAAHIDEIAVIRSMYAQVPNHEPSLMLMNCGDAQMTRPSMGSWVMYGLGTENQNLPGFISMCPGGYPVKEAENWGNGFLPGAFQGTYVDTQHTDVARLIENIRSNDVSAERQRRQMELLREMNRDHQAARSADPRLEARIQSFELAFRMQSEASDAFDISGEPQEMKELYGPGVHGRQTLIARRLLERGVRYVQLWHGAGQPWDAHSDLHGNHAKLAAEVDRPAAALLMDLKQRGMLDDTLVIFGGEFGRTPVSEGGSGRDHNPYGFSMVLAGGGVKGGFAYGATDDFGFRAEQDVVHVHDLHATILHLLGLDHERFTYRYAGRDFRLTDVSGNVVREILA
jgi:hypothetical protein